MPTKPKAAPKRRGYCGIPSNAVCEKYHAHAIVEELTAPQSSPLPWTKFQTDGGWYIDSGNDNGADIRPIAQRMSEANAALIVRRVNQGPAFDAMVEALDLTLVWLDDRVPHHVRERVKAALALARDTK